LFGHDGDEVDGGGCGGGGFGVGGADGVADLEDGDVVGEFLDGFDVEGVEGAVVVFGGEAHLAALEVGDVDVAGGAGGGSGGLEHRGDEGGAVVDLVELLGAEVVDEDVEGEDVFESGEGEVLVEEGVHGAIVDGEDGDGLAAVYLVGEVGGGEIVVEGGEAWVFLEDARDVVGGAGGGGEEEKEKGKEEEKVLH